VFNGHLSLNVTAYMTEQAMIGAFVRAPLPNSRESKQQDNG
jgi:hypothetical protein